MIPFQDRVGAKEDMSRGVSGRLPESYCRLQSLRGLPERDSRDPLDAAAGASVNSPVKDAIRGRQTDIDPDIWPSSLYRGVNRSR
jgi:hypothetical protein